MDRSERPRNRSNERLELNHDQRWDACSMGTLVLRSGMVFPRIPSVLDVSRVSSVRTGVVANYYDQVHAEIARWAVGGA